MLRILSTAFVVAHSAIYSASHVEVAVLPWTNYWRICGVVVDAGNLRESSSNEAGTVFNRLSVTAAMDAENPLIGNEGLSRW